MSELINPFTEFNDALETLSYPKFTRPHKYTISLSDEALSGIEKLLAKHKLPNISTLLEIIGLHVLTVVPYEQTIDDETGITSEEIRQIGYEDGFNGNSKEFVELFSRQYNTLLQQAYLRGFYEGNYIRQTAYKE